MESWFDIMTITEVIALKIINYCNQEDISFNEFSLRCGLTQSTIQNIVTNKSKNIKINTLSCIAKGMNMNLKNFYQDKLFEEKLNN